MITQQELQERFDYKDGQLIYKIKPCSKMKIGDVAGCVNKNGYIIIRINKIYRAHRLIYIYHNGEIPEGMEIDHINTIKADNRIENLRLSTRSQNACNTSKYKTNTSGFKGVHFHSVNKNWIANITINGKKTHLGSRDTPEAAYELYKSAAEKHHKQFANY